MIQPIGLQRALVTLSDDPRSPFAAAFTVDDHCLVVEVGPGHPTPQGGIKYQFTVVDCLTRRDYPEEINALYHPAHGWQEHSLRMFADGLLNGTGETPSNVTISPGCRLYIHQLHTPEDPRAQT